MNTSIPSYLELLSSRVLLSVESDEEAACSCFDPVDFFEKDCDFSLYETPLKDLQLEQVIVSLENSSLSSLFDPDHLSNGDYINLKNALRHMLRLYYGSTAIPLTDFFSNTIDIICQSTGFKKHRDAQVSFENIALDSSVDEPTRLYAKLKHEQSSTNLYRIIGYLNEDSLSWVGQVMTLGFLFNPENSDALAQTDARIWDYFFEGPFPWFFSSLSRESITSYTRWTAIMGLSTLQAGMFSNFLQDISRAYQHANLKSMALEEAKQLQEIEPNLAELYTEWAQEQEIISDLWVAFNPGMKCLGILSLTLSSMSAWGAFPKKIGPLETPYLAGKVLSTTYLLGSLSFFLHKAYHLYLKPWVEQQVDKDSFYLELLNRLHDEQLAVSSASYPLHFSEARAAQSLSHFLNHWDPQYFTKETLNILAYYPEHPKSLDYLKSVFG